MYINSNKQITKARFSRLLQHPHNVSGTQEVFSEAPHGTSLLIDNIMQLLWKYIFLPKKLLLKNTPNNPNTNDATRWENEPQSMLIMTKAQCTE